MQAPVPGPTEALSECLGSSEQAATAMHVLYVFVVHLYLGMVGIRRRAAGDSVVVHHACELQRGLRPGSLRIPRGYRFAFTRVLDAAIVLGWEVSAPVARVQKRLLHLLAQKCEVHLCSQLQSEELPQPQKDDKFHPALKPHGFELERNVYCVNG